MHVLSENKRHVGHNTTVQKKDIPVNDLTLNNINQSFTMLMMLSIKGNLICFSTL